VTEHVPDPPAHEWRRDGYIISTDRARIDVDVVHGYLARSYWAEDIPRDTVARAIAGALNFGIYIDVANGARPPSGVGAGDGAQPSSAVSAPLGPQVGGARIISDYATFAYLADVFVLEEHRGHGLAIWMMECVAAHPSLQGLRRWMLGTRDAHTLYEKTGWTPVAAPDRWMERSDPDVYKR
jgi:GNAT superfamily N-acetyltransferase